MHGYVVHTCMDMYRYIYYDDESWHANLGPVGPPGLNMWACWLVGRIYVKGPAKPKDKAKRER